MGDRRMLTRKVTDDDHFMSLSSSAQALYLHLSMSADDDGFCNQVALCMFKAHASVSDLEALLTLRYVYQFESGVIVIKHWRMANALRKDRYTPTVWQKEYAKLSLKENGAYTLNGGCQMVANGLPNGCPNISKDKITKDKSISSGDKHHPTLEEVKAYCQERGNKVDPERWFDYYTSNGWKVGKNPMRDWKAAVRTWERTDEGRVYKGRKVTGPHTFFNYKEANKSHADLKDIEADLDTDFGGPQEIHLDLNDL